MRPRGRHLGIWLALFAYLARSQANAMSVLEPHGVAAARIAGLWWVMFTIAAVVFAVVIVLLLVAVFKGRSGGTSPPLWATPFIVISGIVIPAIILVSLLVYSLGATAALAAPSDPEDALTIQVVGYQWWWEVRYPDQQVVTANEIHIPVGRPVRLELTSADVIHSFWVPSLNGKMDLIPGRTTTLWIEAAEPGIYRGSCAEYCGLQHAKMGLMVVADRPELFAGWLAGQQEPAPEPDTAVEQEGLQVFLSSACVYCHTVRGTNASGQIGPDLTHLDSRMTLGAAAISNNRGHLAGWIVNSQTIKPGNRMPPMYLDADDLQALLTYLESLD